MSEELIVNLEEFADLCRVTAETMRTHIRTVEGNPAWLIERGDRGKGYRIEAHGGLEWWRARKEGEELAEASRQKQLQQLRLNLTGGVVEQAETMSLSGRARREEYGAAFDAIRLRKEMGRLIETASLEEVLTGAAVELRRRFEQIPGQFIIEQGLDPKLVQPLKLLHGRAIDEFLEAISKRPGADNAA